MTFIWFFSFSMLFKVIHIETLFTCYYATRWLPSALEYWVLISTFSLMKKIVIYFCSLLLLFKCEIFPTSSHV